MRKVYLLFLIVGVLIFSRCAGNGPRAVVTTGKIDVSNGKSYLRMVVRKKDYNNYKKGKPFTSIFVSPITNINGRHIPDLNQCTNIKYEYYEIAYFAKAMGYKAYRL